MNNKVHKQKNKIQGLFARYKNLTPSNEYIGQLDLEKTDWGFQITVWRKTLSNRAVLIDVYMDGQVECYSRATQQTVRMSVQFLYEVVEVLLYERPTHRLLRDMYATPLPFTLSTTKQPKLLIKKAFIRIVTQHLPHIAKERNYPVSTYDGFIRVALDTLYGKPWELVHPKTNKPILQSLNLSEFERVLEIIDGWLKDRKVLVQQYIDSLEMRGYPNPNNFL